VFASVLKPETVVVWLVYDILDDDACVEVDSVRCIEEGSFDDLCEEEE